MIKKMKSKEAFTLIELLVVIVVLGILVLLASPKILDYVEKAELVRIQHDVKVMEQEMKIALMNEKVESAEWNKNKKNLGTLAMQSKLFEKEGVAEKIDASHLVKNGVLVSKYTEKTEFAQVEIDGDLGVGGTYFTSAADRSNNDSEFTSVDETYKIIPKEYKDVIRTKLDGTFYTNEDGKVYYEHDKPITGETNGNKILNCPYPLPDYDFEPETGTILKWHGTVTHLIIPEAFKATINGEEECVPVRIIGKAAFMQGGFRSIVIPQSVVRIEEYAFENNHLTEINISHSVKYIGGNAFGGNNFGFSGGSSTIIIRNNSSNITIESGAFGGSSPTFRPVSPKDLNVIFEPSSGRIVSGQSTSKIINIPESFWIGGVEYPVKQIDKGAYQGLGLISVILPSGLERIEDYAFSGNQLEGITIPDKVNHIGNYAFSFNEVIHSKTGHKKATIGFVDIKQEEQFDKINQYGDIYENSIKVDRLKNTVKLLNHIFVTSIGNHVVNEEYVNIHEVSSPTEVLKKNYETIIYVNAEPGAFANALTLAKDGDLIVLDEGVYKINSLLDIHNNYGVDIIGQGSNTIIEVDKKADLTRSLKNNMYKLTIQPSSTFPSSKYMLAGHATVKLTFNVEYNNILFKDPHNRLLKGDRHATYIVGDHSRNVEHNYQKLEFNNSVSIGMPLVSTWADYNDGRVKPNVKITNSATNVERLDSPNNEYGLGYQHDILIKTTSLESALFDENYNINSHEWENVGTGTNADESPANIGLYGGPFGW